MIHAERPIAYMVGLDLAGRRCVVLGGGGIAAQRVAGLLDAGALVTVVATDLEPAVRDLADRGAIGWTRRAYRRGDLDGAFLALNTTGDDALDSVVAEEAAAGGVLLNTHDRPRACDFATPALVRRGRLQIAVSTSGDSPYVAAALRERLEQLIGEEWGSLLALVARVRRRLRRDGVPASEQQRIYRTLLRSGVRTALRRDERAASVDALTADAVGVAESAGTVHLVGAGPGDPGLLTLRGRDLLLDADVVFHDALVSPEVLRLCEARTRLVDVGKRAGGARLAQTEINALLIDAARSGFEVVRLKGGDPFVFGRGGEELDALRAAGIDADVVPGVTSAFAAAAAAHIPVTFRHVAGSVAVVTGQDRDGELPANLERIARAVDTVVVLMPLGVLQQIAARLIPVLGWEWPAALVAGATTADQRVVRTSLGRLAAAAADARLAAPVTLVLGRVVDAVRAPAGSGDSPVTSGVAGRRP